MLCKFSANRAPHRIAATLLTSQAQHMLQLPDADAFQTQHAVHHRQGGVAQQPSQQPHAQEFSWMLVCREAKIHDALLFFDECEAIFEDREKHGSNHVNMLLTEVEKHEGIIIMATNR